MPAYNAETTLFKTVSEIDRSVVDEIILVDDASKDNTAYVAAKLGLVTIRHDSNKGYGGNQKTCYKTAIEYGADIIIMVHPDYQYTPKLSTAMASMLAYDIYDVVLASRILGKGALQGGMPKYKYVFNRLLTFIENILLGQKLSEYHTGYRGFTREVLVKLPLDRNSNDFVFDNQMIAQIQMGDFKIGEISCPTLYDRESSSISFRRSVIYGFGVLMTACQYRLQKMGFGKWAYLNGIAFEGNTSDEAENMRVS